MLTYLALKIPGTGGNSQEVKAPSVVPTGGLEDGQAGRTLLENGILMFLIFVAVLSVIFLIWGGIKWITSNGDKTKLDSARKTIIYALIGLVLAFLSFTIISFVGQQFGISFM